MSSPISHVSDTAHWVAMYRAMESERPDALFHDPYARRLAGPQGEQIIRSLPKAKAFAWPMVVRTAVMDEVIVRAIDRDGVKTVVNLAAGLDARPYRLDLPRALRWIDVDLPAMQDYKREALRGETPRWSRPISPTPRRGAPCSLAWRRGHHPRSSSPKACSSTSSLPRSPSWDAICTPALRSPGGSSISPRRAWSR